MSARTGLAAKVPTLELCKQLANVKATFFGKSALVFHRVGACAWTERPSERANDCGKEGCVPAPFVEEMLEYLRMLPGDKVSQSCWTVSVDGDDEQWGITDADDVAHACIEATKADA